MRRTLAAQKSQPLAGSLHVGSSARASTSPWASSSCLEPAGALAGPSIEYTSPWIFASAKSNTPCRARRRPSARRTPRGNGTARQASEVGRSDPRAMHACSVTPESPCQHTECSGAELCRNPATGGEPSCHPLAARLVGAVCCRASSAPYKTIKWLDSAIPAQLPPA